MELEFEKPILDLEKKLDGMKDIAKDSDVDVSEAIKALEEKIKTLKKETFENLTRWQRVQLSRHPERPYALDYIYAMSKAAANTCIYPASVNGSPRTLGRPTRKSSPSCGPICHPK